MPTPVEIANEKILSRVLNILARRALVTVRGRIPSKTLQRSLKIELLERRAILFLPHYWAIYVHDGRGPVKPVDAVWLVWFANPENDPRLAAGYPVRGGDVRRLTRRQWFEGLERNRENAEKGLGPYMIVRKYSGPAQGVPFFAQLRIADAVTASLVTAILTQELQDLVPSERDTARIRL